MVIRDRGSSVDEVIGEGRPSGRDPKEVAEQGVGVPGTGLREQQRLRGRDRLGYLGTGTVPVWLEGRSAAYRQWARGLSEPNFSGSHKRSNPTLTMGSICFCWSQGLSCTSCEKTGKSLGFGVPVKRGTFSGG